MKKQNITSEELSVVHGIILGAGRWGLFQHEVAGKSRMRGRRCRNVLKVLAKVGLVKASLSQRGESIERVWSKV